MHTEVFEMPGAPAGEPAVNEVTFSEVDGRTTLSLLARTPSRQVRDAIMESGMEGGMQEQMDLLEELARSLR